MSRLTLNNFRSVTTNIDWGIVAANGSGEMTVTVQDAAVGDAVILGPPVSFNAGLVIAWYAVTSANTVTIRLRNETGSAVDPASASWKVVVLKT